MSESSARSASSLYELPAPLLHPRAADALLLAASSYPTRALRKPHRSAAVAPLTAPVPPGPAIAEGAS